MSSTTPVTFYVLRSYMWLVATIMISTDVRLLSLQKVPLVSTALATLSALVGPYFMDTLFLIRRTLY